MKPLHPALAPSLERLSGRRAWLRSASLGLLACSGARVWAQAARESIPVLYPEIGEPFRSVFEHIMDGIDERLPQRSVRMAVAAQADPQTVVGELKRRRPTVVIALGRVGLRAATALDTPTDIVGGGIISPTQADARIATLHSLAPDPALLMARLKQLQPAVRRVQVVYASTHSAWLVRLAQQAARVHGLELKAWEVEDLRGAVQRYQELLGNSTAHDALWLPQDPITVEESTVVPLVLKEAWNRSLPLFSSNLAHVRRGALFALFPNNAELGHSLGASALAHLQQGSGAPRGVLPLRDVYAGLNVRTASHLGLDYNPKLHGSFDTLLPER